MSDLAKWGFITACIVATVALIIQLPAYGYLDDIFTDGGTAEVVANGISVFTSSLVIARQIINNFVYPPALSACIMFSLFMWIVLMTIRFSTFLTRMIYK